MLTEGLHRAGEELLDALERRLGWRPAIVAYEGAAPWYWRALQRVLGRRCVVLGRTLYVFDAFVLRNALYAATLLAHEGAHWIIGRTLPFYLVYFLQQLIFLGVTGAVAALNALGFGHGWEWALTLLFVAVPWPAPNRAEVEAEAYAMGIVAQRFFGVPRQDAVEQAAQAMAHTAYWMTPWPFHQLLLRAYQVMVLRALATPRPALIGWQHDVQDIAKVWGATYYAAPEERPHA